MLVVQSDAFNRSRIHTVVGVVISSNVSLAKAPGNVLLPSKSKGLRRQSVAKVSQVVTLEETLLTKRVRRVPKREMAALDAGLRLILQA